MAVKFGPMLRNADPITHGSKIPFDVPPIMYVEVTCGGVVAGHITQCLEPERDPENLDNRWRLHGGPKPLPVNGWATIGEAKRGAREMLRRRDG